MDLKEAKEMATDLITVKDTPVYMRPMCEALMLLDDRLTELGAERDELIVAIAKVEGQRNVLFGLCEDALVKCSFPVGAALLREKMQAAVDQTEDAILNTIEDSDKEV